MSYINKPGKTSAWRSMVTRQQMSDALSHHQIVTTLTKAKITQKYLERLITLAKVDTIANRREAARALLTTKIFDRDELVKYLFTKVAPKFKTRQGGYTRVVKVGSRRGDAVEAAILQFVVTLPSTRKSTKSTKPIKKSTATSKDQPSESKTAPAANDQPTPSTTTQQ